MGKYTLTPEIVAASRLDPIFYLECVLGLEHIAPYQRVIGDALKSSTFEEVAARSANGVGKSFIAACFANWWFDTRKDSIVVIAGPGLRNAKETFSKAMELRRRAPFDLPGDPKAERIELNPFWHIQARAAKSPEAFAGVHAPGGVLVIMEEASGQADDIYAAAYGCVTENADKMLHIGNPTQPFGTFASLWKDKTGKVKTLTISAMESPNVIAGRTVIPGIVGKRGVERLIARFGANSDTVRVRVHGLPPVGSGNGVFSFLDIEAAKTRGEALVDENGEVIDYRLLDPVIVGGLDLARMGADKCAIAQITDGVFDRVIEWEKLTIDKSAERAAQWLAQTGPSSLLYVDTGGLGVGVYDILRSDSRYRHRVYGVDFGGKQVLGKVRTNAGEVKWKAGVLDEGDTPMYHDRRSELWFEAAEWTREVGTWHPELPDDLREELEADLQSVEIDPSFTSAMKIEKKEKTKQRISRSPDFGDAYCLAVMALVERRLGLSSRSSRARKKPKRAESRRESGRRRDGFEGYAPAGIGLEGM